MTDKTAPRLSALLSFLDRRGWSSLPDLGDISRFGQHQYFAPPPELDLPDDYFLHLPRDEDAPAAASALRKIRSTLAEIYDTSTERIDELLTTQSLVFSIQLQSADYADGSIPLLRFEAVVEKIKKTLLDTASFVIGSEAPVGTVPEAATKYLQRCRFLQTEIGSYVARVQLPESVLLGEPDLFGSVVESNEVNNRFTEMLRFIVGPLLNGPEAEVFNEDSFESTIDLVNLDVLKDVRELLDRSGADSINFRFAGVATETTLPSGPITPQYLERFDRYIDFARERFAPDIELDVTGRIVELRSRSLDRMRNYVGIAGLHDGREVFLSLRLNRRDYSYAVMIHNRNRPVRIRGAAKRMKTQYRITRLDYLEELAQPGE